MSDTSNFRNGMVIELDDTLYQITYFQHVKPGKGGAFVRTKLKDVMAGGITDKTFRAGEKIKEVRLERRPIQYSYTDGNLFYFMSLETYEQIPLSREQLGEDQLLYLQAETDPGVRGDTAQGGTKPAKLVTGAVVQVPLFVEEGEMIRVDRTEDKYITRVHS